MRLCSVCGKEFPFTLSFFYVNHTSCKTCTDYLNKKYAYKGQAVKNQALKDISEPNRKGALCGSVRQNKACSPAKQISIEQYLKEKGQNDTN